MEPSSQMELLAHLKTSGTLSDERIENAFKACDRRFFIVEEMKARSYEDRALPVAAGQTISQPTTVAIMLELLSVEPGNNILDIGAGTGWTACLLSNLAGRTGKVWAYEINRTVGEYGMANVRRIGADNVSYCIADAAAQWEEHAPFDRIHAAAAFDQIPENLKSRLKPGGILVAPTKDGYLRRICRLEEGSFREEKYYGFAFVPFRTSA